MDISGPGLIFAVIPFFGSVVFFYLAKELTFPCRLLASIHGWAALSMYPFSALMAIRYPDVKMSVGLPIVLLLGGLSSVSIFYSIAMVRARWLYHLLHIPTIFVIGLSVVVSLFMMADHH